MQPETSPNRRIARVKELLRQELSEIIRREFNIEEIGLLTVNDVGVSRDLRSAIVFLGFVGTSAQRKLAPQRVGERAKLIQSMVGGAIRLKFTPELRFQVGDAVAEGNRVIALLDELQPAGPAPGPPPIPPA
jgi:ribosome-binding factor A